jgi:hypothetical protein
MANEHFSIIYGGNIVQADLLKCLLEGEGIVTTEGQKWTSQHIPK